MICYMIRHPYLASLEPCHSIAQIKGHLHKKTCLFTTSSFMQGTIIIPSSVFIIIATPLQYPNIRLHTSSLSSALG
ncbi:hypothetical protein HBI38_184340 [Parastagonospora nodorum]|nr:hypothetical protein HBI41_152200 [Parastagonospora nodorum]KAH6284919.1 hypothetical protein HBI40_127590 [Parastagonospora nodorum]KAH6309055.1 hypothetical protein HBI38_184340 [Parastagonospora nodorum]